MPRVVWAEESKTGPGFEIGQPQQKCSRKPSLQWMANPAVMPLPSVFDQMLT